MLYTTALITSSSSDFVASGASSHAIPVLADPSTSNFSRNQNWPRPTKQKTYEQKRLGYGVGDLRVPALTAEGLLDVAGQSLPRQYSLYPANYNDVDSGTTLSCPPNDPISLFSMFKKQTFSAITHHSITWTPAICCILTPNKISEISSKMLQWRAELRPLTLQPKSTGFSCWTLRRAFCTCLLWLPHMWKIVLGSASLHRMTWSFCSQVEGQSNANVLSFHPLDVHGHTVLVYGIAERVLQLALTPVLMSHSMLQRVIRPTMAQPNQKNPASTQYLCVTNRM